MDVNLFSVTSEHDCSAVMPGDLIADPRIYDDALKVSGAKDVDITVHRASGGREDVVDVNNKAEAVMIQIDEAVVAGKYLATIKGGSDGVYLSIGRVITVPGKRPVIEVGNWSDQSNEKTKNVTVVIYDSDQPILVRVLNGFRPWLCGNVEYRYLFPHPDAWYHDIVVKAVLGAQRVWKRLYKVYARIRRAFK